MYLDKVKDLKQIKLGPNQVLVEIIEKKSKIILASGNGEPSSAIEREEVFLSNAEGINAGDIILEARYDVGGEIGFHDLDGRKFVVVTSHNIKMWTSEENFKKENQDG